MRATDLAHITGITDLVGAGDSFAAAGISAERRRLAERTTVVAR